MKQNLEVVQIGFKVGHECLVNEGVPLGTALRWKDSVLSWSQERKRIDFS